MQKITSACAISFEDNVLLVNKRQPGKDNWDIPDRQVGDGEDVLVSVKKAIKEQTGLVFEPILKKVYFYHADGSDIVNFLFACRLNENPTLFPYTSEHIAEVTWFTKDEIEYLLSNGKYEHELARRRFKDLLLGFGINLDFVQL